MSVLPLEGGGISAESEMPSESVRMSESVWVSESAGYPDRVSILMKRGARSDDGRLHKESESASLIGHAVGPLPSLAGSDCWLLPRPWWGPGWLVWGVRASLSLQGDGGGSLTWTEGAGAYSHDAADSDGRRSLLAVCRRDARVVPAAARKEWLPSQRKLLYKNLENIL